MPWRYLTASCWHPASAVSAHQETEPGHRRSTSTKPQRRYIVTAEVPGSRARPDRSRVRGSHLTIRGRRSDRDAPTDIVHYHQVERGHGSFARRSNLPTRSTSTSVICRSRRRRADRHAAKGAAVAGAQGFRCVCDVMMQTHSASPLSFSSVGFVAGLVLTGRMRTAEDAAAAGAGHEPALQTAGRPVARSSPTAAARARPDRRRHSSRSSKRAQHLVDAGRPHVELAVRERPVLPRLLRRRQPVRRIAIACSRASAPASSSPPMATCSPTTTSSATRDRRGLGHAARQARAAARRSSASTRPPTSPC